ncbi:MAG TPA: hypothetical protein DCG12_17075, partial [Planctomycetaceae bacterium]|nr:hypothetical protein [Planctomycetaceae bacterium]
MSHDEHSQDHGHDDHGHVNYLYVFFALMGFTLLSVLFDTFDNYVVKVALVLAVAVAKAMCVMMFFMHLKFEGNWKYVVLAPTSILAVGLIIALLPDIGVAYYTPLVPQSEWLEVMKEHKAHHHGHGEEGEHGDAESHGDA